MNKAAELAALARMITFARQTANDLGAEKSASCLDLALKAVLNDLQMSGVNVALVSGEFAEDGAKRMH